jgi:protein-L-isoaspartate O-methyltransferase
MAKSKTQQLLEWYADRVRRRVARDDFVTKEQMAKALRSLAQWRSQLIALTIVNDSTIVQSGPFAGMDYLAESTEGGLAPRLLGSYESELHPAIEAFAAADLDVIIDIGSAEGYYAVGMARIAPRVTVHAYDIDPKARAACADLALRNGVSDRVIVGGEFKGEDFAAFADRKVLVLMDAEGAEDALLDPARWPALRDMNLIVETHNMYAPGVTDRLTERFEQSHDIENIEQTPRIMARPDWLKKLSHLDQLLAIWEWRAGPTPWLVMRPKADGAAR